MPRVNPIVPGIVIGFQSLFGGFRQLNFLSQLVKQIRQLLQSQTAVRVLRKQTIYVAFRIVGVNDWNARQAGVNLLL